MVFFLIGKHYLHGNTCWLKQNHTENFLYTEVEEGTQSGMLRNPANFQDMNQNEVRVLRVSETRLYFFFLFLEEKELCEISGLV